MKLRDLVYEVKATEIYLLDLAVDEDRKNLVETEKARFVCRTFGKPCQIEVVWTVDNKCGGKSTFELKTRRSISEIEFEKLIGRKTRLDNPIALANLKTEDALRSVGLYNQNPKCPKCGSGMFLRRSKGHRFWGCARSPSCEGKVEI